MKKKLGIYCNTNTQFLYYSSFFPSEEYEIIRLPVIDTATIQGLEITQLIVDESEELLK